MRSTTFKLLAAFSLMPIGVLGLRFAGNDLFFVVFLVGFVLSIMFWLDLGRLLRQLENPTPWQRVLGVLFGIPQALFGLVCVAIGSAIVVWVLYNSLVERSTAYSGGFLTFGIGPALVLFGAGWVVYAFKRVPKSEPSYSPDGEHGD
jgi:hypothetical protein